MRLVNETGHDVLNNRGCKDDADESTASFGEDPGDTDDYPMSVVASVSSARIYCMPLLVAP